MERATVALGFRIWGIWELRVRMSYKSRDYVLGCRLIMLWMMRTLYGVTVEAVLVVGRQHRCEHLSHQGPDSK